MVMAEDIQQIGAEAQPVEDKAADKMHEAAEEAASQSKEAINDVANKAESAESKVLDKVSQAQEKLGEATPVATNLDKIVSPEDVKSRLNWGEPALTILDTRDRSEYNQERITGAMLISSNELAERVRQSLSSEREIYIYGDSDEATATAFTQFQDAGFSNVHAIEGGLSAWKAAGGPTEGNYQRAGIMG